jgi:hypothetical protein
MEASAYNLLLDIDALFDTRMGTLIQLDDEIFKHLPIKDYRNRQMDDFEKLTGGRVKQADYLAKYSARNIETLSNSKTTGIVPILMHYIEGLKERLFRGVDVSSIAIDINLYPYIVPGPIAETIRGCVDSLMPEYVVSRTVFIDPATMTPTALEYAYNGWIVYNFHPWLEKHHTELLVTKLNGLSVILPRLFIEEPGERVIEEHEGTFKPEDRHGQFEMIMEEYIHLEHIPVSDFCFLLPGTYTLPDEVALQASDASS